MQLKRIFIYPIKSLDAVDCTERMVLPSGALAGDRQFALLDAEDRLVNGKNEPKVHQVRAYYDQSVQSVTLQLADQAKRGPINLHADQSELATYFSECFAGPINMLEDADAGIPDDTEAPGPTIIGTQTLELVSQWFPNITVEEVRRRFRANLELETEYPFQEDTLLGPSGGGMFQIGDVRFIATNPCQRCTVPARDSRTGETTARFQIEFAKLRQTHFPSGHSSEQFNHYYRLAVNTKLAPNEPGGTIRVGDTVRMSD